jgi:hypothetical protein
MQIHRHRCGRRRVGVVCMCCPRVWVAMVLTSSGRSLHHAAAAPDSGCGGGSGGRMVVACEYRGCPRRRGEPARVIQLKASFNHTAVHSTPHRRSLCRFIFTTSPSTLQVLVITSLLGYIFRWSPLSEPQDRSTRVVHGSSLILRVEVTKNVKLRNVSRIWIFKLFITDWYNSLFSALERRKHIDLISTIVFLLPCGFR